VITDPAKKGGRWDPESFFESGRAQVRGALELVATLAGPLERGAALDFGSGVGRLSQALCEHFEVVDGVDIAQSMIDVAERCNRFPERCTYHLNLSDDLSIFPNGRFDFVYSTYVLQHMPPDLARGYVEEFLRVLAPHGVTLFQIPTGRRSGRARSSLVVWARNRLKPHARHEMRMYTTPARTVEAWIESADGHLIGEIHSPPDEVYDGLLFAATRGSLRTPA
jgi:2-polyprenyl-3-methyl-5-hydroxy-6-metoxy-1,4-benzoquinol methylase